MPLTEIANLSLDKENNTSSESPVVKSPVKKDAKSPVKKDASEADDKLSAAIAERKRIDALEPLLQVIKSSHLFLF